MGEWYTIGLQAGKKVAEKVDAFIAAEHKSDRLGENFDPEKKYQAADSSTVYIWSMKWQPSWYEVEKRFIDVLEEFYEDGPLAKVFGEKEFPEEYAWKLVAVGNEGGDDERGNEIGFEIFDELYYSRRLVEPDPVIDGESGTYIPDWETKPGKYFTLRKYVSGELETVFWDRNKVFLSYEAAYDKMCKLYMTQKKNGEKPVRWAIYETKVTEYNGSLNSMTQPVWN